MSRTENIPTREIEMDEFRECLEIVKDIECLPETNLTLIKMAKNTWRSGNRYWISDINIISMIKAGMEDTPFSYNHVFVMDRDNTQGSLKYRMFPDMVDAGMLIKDTSGRYDKYTLTVSGFNWLAYALFKTCDCKLSGICQHCVNDNSEDKKHKCWSCGDTKVCPHCNESFERFTIDELVALIRRFPMPQNIS